MGEAWSSLAWWTRTNYKSITEKWFWYRKKKSRALGVESACPTSIAWSESIGLGWRTHWRIPASPTWKRGHISSSDCRQAHSPEKDLSDFNRFASFSSAGRCVYWRWSSKSIWESSRSVTGISSLRRAMGQALARPGEIRRDYGAWIWLRYSQCMEIPRLRHKGL